MHDLRNVISSATQLLSELVFDDSADKHNNLSDSNDTKLIMES